MDTIPIERALTALAVWEELLKRDHDTHFDLVSFWDETGTAEMRVHTLTIAKWVDDIYAAMPEESIDGIAFDWDFIPLALNLIDWDKCKPDEIKFPSVETAAKFVAEKLKQTNP